MRVLSLAIIYLLFPALLSIMMANVGFEIFM